MKSKLTECKSCGKEIAKNAKSCPSCGAKNKKPFYKRVWFIALCAFIVIGMIGSIGEDTSTQQNVEQSQNSQVAPSQQVPVNQEQEQEQEDVVITYEEVSVDDMMDALKDNALKAKSTYDGKYLKITGRLNVIDSDGKYISLLPIHDEWAFLGVQCSIENEAQLNQIMEMSLGDTVVLSGEIKSVGEVMGYSLDIDTIE